jgi:hypothetical protein
VWTLEIVRQTPGMAVVQVSCTDVQTEVIAVCCARLQVIILGTMVLVSGVSTSICWLSSCRLHCMSVLLVDAHAAMQLLLSHSDISLCNAGLRQSFPNPDIPYRQLRQLAPDSTLTAMACDKQAQLVRLFKKAVHQDVPRPAGVPRCSRRPGLPSANPACLIVQAFTNGAGEAKMF